MIKNYNLKVLFKKYICKKTFKNKKILINKITESLP